jgi:dipeptidyl aminopeptidase/acylaminoacyl peptidase
MKAVFPVSLALLVLPAFATPVPRRAPDLRTFRRLVRIVSPVFSPGGGRILFVTVRADFVHNRYDRTLWVESLKEGRPRAIVRAMKGLAEPRWAPDGRTITFLASVYGAKPQIYAVAAGGGTPRRLSRAPQGVEQYAWSPGGRRIAYVTPDPPRFSARDRRSGHDLFAVHDDDYLISAPPAPSEIWVLTLPTFAVRQITHGPTSVLEGAPPLMGSVSPPSWSADGRWIVYTRQRDADDSDTEETTIVALPAAGGPPRVLTAHRNNEYDPFFAPRGDRVAYLYPHGPGPVSDMDVFLTSLRGGRARDLSADLDRNVATTYAWMPSGRALVALADSGVRSRLYLQPLAGRGRTIPTGGLNPLDLAVSSRGAIAFVGDGAARAPELYVLARPGARPRRLTRFNRAFRRVSWPRSVAIVWHAPDGTLDDGILTYPLGYRPGRRYPLVVFSHGGPEAASTEHFDAGEIGPLRDVFAARGDFVFEPNYRGSDNLGNAHLHAIYRDPGAGPDRDVVSGIRLLEKRGLVDPHRIAAVGHSYGGYLTAWLIGHQHFWRCAVVADGVTDWTEEYELSGAGNMAWTRDSLGGSPWNPRSRRLYVSGSPITYAARITTPTLILSGTADVTVPITESFALYHALQNRHVPVRFLAIPGAYHMPQDPVQLALFYRAIVRWVDRYLGR